MSWHSSLVIFRLWSSLGNILLNVLCHHLYASNCGFLLPPAGCPCSSHTVQTVPLATLNISEKTCSKSSHQLLNHLSSFKTQLPYSLQVLVKSWNHWTEIWPMKSDFAYEMMFDFCQGNIPLSAQLHICLCVCVCAGMSVCICVRFQENRKIKATEMMEVRAPFHAYNHSRGPIGRVKLSRASVCLFSPFQTAHTRTHTHTGRDIDVTTRAGLPFLSSPSTWPFDDASLAHDNASILLLAAV